MLACGRLVATPGVRNKLDDREPRLPRLKSATMSLTDRTRGSALALGIPFTKTAWAASFWCCSLAARMDAFKEAAGSFPAGGKGATIRLLSFSGCGGIDIGPVPGAGWIGLAPGAWLSFALARSPAAPPCAVEGFAAGGVGELVGRDAFASISSTASGPRRAAAR